MKVSIDTRFDSLENQGQGRITLDVKRALDKYGHNYIVNKCMFKSNYGYLYNSLLGKCFRRNNSDIYLAMTSMDSLYIPPEKSVVIIHDLIPLLNQFTTLSHYNNTIINQIGSLTFFYLTLCQAIKFKKIICISEKTRNELFSVFPELDKNKVILLPNSVQAKYKPKKRTNKEKLRLYTVSVLDPRKRSMELIEWFNNWSPDNIELYIGGKGSLLEECKKKCKDNSNLYVLGEIPEKYMLKWYHNADIVLFPTKNEGFGLPIIEAACSGRLVLTLKDAKIPEEVRDCTVVCEDWDSMKELIKQLNENPKTIDTISSDLTKRAQKFQFDWDERIVKILEEVGLNK